MNKQFFIIFTWNAPPSPHRSTILRIFRTVLPFSNIKKETEGDLVVMYGQEMLAARKDIGKDTADVK